MLMVINILIFSLNLFIASLFPLSLFHLFLKTSVTLNLPEVYSLNQLISNDSFWIFVFPAFLIYLNSRTGPSLHTESSALIFPKHLDQRRNGTSPAQCIMDISLYQEIIQSQRWGPVLPQSYDHLSSQPVLSQPSASPMQSQQTHIWSHLIKLVLLHVLSKGTSRTRCFLPTRLGVMTENKMVFGVLQILPISWQLPLLPITHIAAAVCWESLQ